MSLTTTTLSSACAASDTSIVVASATGFAAGSFILIDNETLKVSKGYVSGTTIPVVRGQNGSFADAHPATANVTVGVGSDFSDPNATVVTPYALSARRRKLASYSASGAITLPVAGEDVIAVLNGTSVLAMTVATPTKDQDGSILYIVGNGAAAHTITFTGGLSGAGTSYDVITVNATAPICVQAIAVNGLWMSMVTTPMAGTVTNITGTVA